MPTDGTRLPFWQTKVYEHKTSQRININKSHKPLIKWKSNQIKNKVVANLFIQMKVVIIIARTTIWFDNEFYLAGAKTSPSEWLHLTNLSTVSDEIQINHPQINKKSINQIIEWEWKMKMWPIIITSVAEFTNIQFRSIAVIPSYPSYRSNPELPSALISHYDSFQLIPVDSNYFHEYEFHSCN